jgi:hypothetical protein
MSTTCNDTIVTEAQWTETRLKCRCELALLKEHEPIQYNRLLKLYGNSNQLLNTLTVQTMLTNIFGDIKAEFITDVIIGEINSLTEQDYYHGEPFKSMVEKIKTLFKRRRK